MIDTVIIGNKSSYDDFDASMKERTIGEPKKKSIKDTVPFSNKIYDFSKINGELYWEERPLDYVFEIMADSPEELEEKKMVFKRWVMNVMEEELHDPYIPDYHFIATFDDCECDDSEVLKSTITVKFTAYPYMVANEKTIYSVSLTANEEKQVVVKNDSAHRVTPTFINDVAVVIARDSESYAISAGKTTDETFQFEEGITVLTCSATTDGTLHIEFLRENF